MPDCITANLNRLRKEERARIWMVCTCKMKVDTHKSVGVYFFRSIMNMERK